MAGTAAAAATARGRRRRRGSNGGEGAATAATTCGRRRRRASHSFEGTAQHVLRPEAPTATAVVIFSDHVARVAPAMAENVAVDLFKVLLLPPAHAAMNEHIVLLVPLDDFPIRR